MQPSTWPARIRRRRRQCSRSRYSASFCFCPCPTHSHRTPGRPRRPPTPFLFLVQAHAGAVIPARRQSRQPLDHQPTRKPPRPSRLLRRTLRAGLPPAGATRLVPRTFRAGLSARTTRHTPPAPDRRPFSNRRPPPLHYSSFALRAQSGSGSKEAPDGAVSFPTPQERGSGSRECASGIARKARSSAGPTTGPSQQ